MTDDDKDKSISDYAPKWARTLGGGLTIAIAVVAGGVGLFSQFGDLPKACEATHICAPGPVKDLQPYSSAWVDGGHDLNQMAGPTLAAYRAANPDYDVQMVAGQEESDKDWLGRVRYKYHATFTATPRWRGFI